MRFAVCDDNRFVLESTIATVREAAPGNEYDSYSNVEQLITLLEKRGHQKISYDIILMDIQWEGLPQNGIQYAARINQILPDAQIIFMTSYGEQYAQDIFYERMNLCGYLIKPIRKKNLVILLEKAKNILNENKKNVDEVLLVQHNAIKEKISQNSIYYLESHSHRVYVHTEDRDILTYGKLDDYKPSLKNSFVVIHKSYIVNMDHINKLEKLTVTLDNGVVLPISKAQVANARDTYLKYVQDQL